jgi:hypothetical protein
MSKFDSRSGLDAVAAQTATQRSLSLPDISHFRWRMSAGAGIACASLMRGENT